MTPSAACQPGRASDGSEHGPCAWCEEMAWRRRLGFMPDDDLDTMIRDVRAIKGRMMPSATLCRASA